MIDKLFAGLILAMCVVMLLRLAVGLRRRDHIDAKARDAWNSICRYAVVLWRWRSSRRTARKLTAEAIERARAGVDRNGNVYKPKSFRGPREPH